MAKRVEGDAGVFNHLMISPYYNKPSDDGLIKHFTRIASGLEGNIILYSVPSRTGGKGITVPVVQALYQHPQIIGLKDASGDLDNMRDIILATGSDCNKFSVLSGDDSLTVEAMKRAGARGVISTAANIVPKEMVDLTRKAEIRDYDRAERISQKLSPLFSALFPKSGIVNPSPNPSTTHYALRRIGFDVGLPPPPLEDPRDYEKAVLDSALRGLEIGVAFRSF